MAIDVYVEGGAKRVVAGAIEWPGWCRLAKSEDEAMEALAAYGPRYAQVVGRRRLGFPSGAGARKLVIVERLRGDATTDFGAPSKAPRIDVNAMPEADLARASAILRACWAAFDRAVDRARGVTLATGPRGGGRSLEKIVAHVMDADGGYLRRIAARAPATDATDPDASLRALRATILEALAAAVRDGLPPTGPRGGALWTPRYYIRRSAWHVLDHAWEIEDRTH